MNTENNTDKGWQPISTAPNNWLRAGIGRCLVGHWHEPRDEDGELTGEADWRWVQVATLSFDGWHVGTHGFKSIHGFASFLLAENATHWMPLPAIAKAQP